MLLVLLLLIVLLILVMRPLLLLVPRVRLLVLAHVPEAAVRAHARVPRPHETGNAETVQDTRREFDTRHTSLAIQEPHTVLLAECLDSSAEVAEDDDVQRVEDSNHVRKG